MAQITRRPPRRASLGAAVANLAALPTAVLPTPPTPPAPPTPATTPRTVPIGTVPPHEFPASAGPVNQDDFQTPVQQSLRDATLTALMNGPAAAPESLPLLPEEQYRARFGAQQGTPTSEDIQGHLDKAESNDTVAGILAASGMPYGAMISSVLANRSRGRARKAMQERQQQAVALFDGINSAPRVRELATHHGFLAEETQPFIEAIATRRAEAISRHEAEVEAWDTHVGRLMDFYQKYSTSVNSNLAAKAHYDREDALLDATIGRVEDANKAYIDWEAREHAQRLAVDLEILGARLKNGGEEGKVVNPQDRYLQLLENLQKGQSEQFGSRMGDLEEDRVSAVVGQVDHGAALQASADFQGKVFVGPGTTLDIPGNTNVVTAIPDGLPDDEREAWVAAARAAYKVEQIEAFARMAGTISKYQLSELAGSWLGREFEQIDDPLAQERLMERLREMATGAPEETGDLTKYYNEAWFRQNAQNIIRFMGRYGYHPSRLDEAFLAYLDDVVPEVRSVRATQRRLAWQLEAIEAMEAEEQVPLPPWMFPRGESDPETVEEPTSSGLWFKRLLYGPGYLFGRPPSLAERGSQRTDAAGEEAAEMAEEGPDWTQEKAIEAMEQQVKPWVLANVPHAVGLGGVGDLRLLHALEAFFSEANLADPNDRAAHLAFRRGGADDEALLKAHLLWLYIQSNGKRPNKEDSLFLVRALGGRWLGDPVPAIE